MLLSFTLLSVLINVLLAESPALIWSSSRSLSDLPQSYVGETISGDAFSKAYLEPLMSNTAHSLVVFLQDKLSIEDFTNHADVYNPNSDGGAFKNVKSAMDDQFSVHIPAVKDAKATIDTISSSFPGELIRVNNPDEFEKLNLEDGKSYLIIVDLQPVQLEKEYESFQKNDETIGKCMHHLNKRGVKYSAIYTAEASSKVEEDSHQGRHLLAAADAESNGTFVAKEGLLLFLDYITVTVTLAGTDQGKPTSLSETYYFKDVNQAAISRENDTFSLALNFTANGTTADIFMALVMNQYFEFEDINGTFTWNPSDPKYAVDSMPMDYKVQATKGFCFHCSSLLAQPVLRELNATDIANRQVALRLNGFQIEAFSNSSSFSLDVWDCVEFFTRPIWMGLMTTLLIVLILFFGITMIANITTMDRFDDPKGKTITVVVNE